MRPAAHLPTVGMPIDELSFVGQAATLLTPEYDVVIYGSRARGDHRWFSDVDIAVFGAPDIFDPKVTILYTVLSNSPMTVQPRIVQVSPYKDEDFVRNILEDGVLVYEGCGEFRRARASAGLPTDFRSLYLPQDLPRPLEVLA